MKMIKKIASAMCICWLCILGSTWAFADDYEGDSQIFSGQASDIAPNVLVIFDTSGSMDQQPYIAGEAYDHNTIYSTCVPSGGTVYPTDNVYYRQVDTWGNESWPLMGTFSQLSCSNAAVLTSLTNNGWYNGNFNTTTRVCGGATSQRLRMGNYRNYLQCPVSSNERTKLEVARTVISNIMSTVTNVRWGLMRFNGTRGGKLIAPCGTPYDNGTANDIQSLIAGDSLFQDSEGTTPLAETLYTAGQYFAGTGQSWSMPSDSTQNWTSVNRAIQYRCQRNYIIVLSDGDSQCDVGTEGGGNIFNANTYINSRIIGDYDHDGRDPGCTNSANCGCGTHWLDDVAKFLHDEDLITDPAGVDGNDGFDASDYPRQYITTYTIGFGEDASGVPLLTRTAQGDWDGTTNAPSNGNYGGGGKFYRAQNTGELVETLSTILGDVAEDSSNFVAPVVPVSRSLRTYSGDSLYLGMFKPAERGIWLGNLKKYKMNDTGILLQADASTPAVDTATGQFASTATSCWSTVIDGGNTDVGGAGAALRLQTTRHFFTYNATRGASSLSSNYNSFATGNNDITSALMGVTDAQRSDLIHYTCKDDTYATNDWFLGDILHSQPATATYSDQNETVIFVGANDGFLHCFVDNDAANTVHEEWCFLPWELLSTIKQRHPSYQANQKHDYYVDGSPVVYTLGTSRYLTFGLRRGGNKYHTLNITDYTDTGVSYAWEIGSTLQTSLAETLGQSWSRPYFCNIKTGSSSYTPVLLLTGGYDNAKEDLDTPTGNDTCGRAVYAVNASNGTLMSNFRFTYASSSNAMTHSIVDLAAFDYDNDANRCVDTVYAGDMSGKLWAFNDRDGNGTWSGPSLIFQARSGSTASSLLKFQNAPDIVLETFGDYVYIGTGDREHPNETTTVNRFYAIKNRWNGVTKTEASTNFADVTTYSDYTTTTHTVGWLRSDTCEGWFIRLREGEKVVSTPLVLDKIVYFTTFIPQAGATATDECATSDLGLGYLWAIDYQTGEAIRAFNFNTGNDIHPGGGAPTVIVLNETDRYKELGQGVPTKVTMITTAEGNKAEVGIKGGVVTIDLPSSNTAKTFYWKQQ